MVTCIFGGVIIATLFTAIYIEYTERNK